MNLLVRLWAWAIGQEHNLIWLLDHNGETSLSIARRNQFGQWVASRYPLYPWLYKVVLLNHGMVRGYSTTCYVKRWTAWIRR